MAFTVVFNHDRGNTADVGEDAEPRISRTEHKLAGLPGIVGNRDRVNPERAKIKIDFTPDQAGFKDIVTAAAAAGAVGHVNGYPVST